MKFRYVGVSHEPWIAIKRLLNRSPESIAAWVEELHTKYPTGLIVYGEAICRIWNNEENVVLPPTRGIPVLPWEILAYEEEETDLSVLERIIPTRSASYTKKNLWIDKLRAEGHDILNGTSGRPAKQQFITTAGESPLPPKLKEIAKKLTPAEWSAIVDYFRAGKP